MLIAYPSKIIVKPSIDSGAGKNIFVFDNGKLSENSFEKFGKDFVVQEFMHQNKMLDQLYPEAIATLRIVTYQLDDKIYNLRSHLRIGSPGTQYIKPSLGAMVCGIHENGSLFDFAYGLNNKIYFEHPDTKVPFGVIRLPELNGAIDKVKAIHKHLPYFKIISWDIGIDQDDEPFLIEFNLMFQGMDVNQILYGPLFMDHTDKILLQVFARENR